MEQPRYFYNLEIMRRYQFIQNYRFFKLRNIILRIWPNRSILVTNVDVRGRSKFRSDKVWLAIMAVYFLLGVNLCFM